MHCGTLWGYCVITVSLLCLVGLFVWWVGFRVWFGCSCVPCVFGFCCCDGWVMGWGWCAFLCLCCVFLLCGALWGYCVVAVSLLCLLGWVGGGVSMCGLGVFVYFACLGFVAVMGG